MTNLVMQLTQRIRMLEEKVNYLLRLVAEYSRELEQYKQQQAREQIR